MIVQHLARETHRRSDREKTLPERDTRDPETNSKFAPENEWLEYFLVSFWVPAYFQVLLLLVLGGVLLIVKRNSRDFLNAAVCEG